VIRRNLPRSFDELAGLRARGLVRESTVEQGDNSGPIVQRQDEEAFATRWGLILEQRRNATTGELEPFLYTDLITGKRGGKRPEFFQMVVDAKAGLFDVLLVRDTSRFFRNWRQAGGYEEQLHDAGVAIAYIVEGKLSTDRTAQLQIVVNHAINEEYREKLIENVQRGYRVKRFERGKFSGTPPIGYLMEFEDVWVDSKRGTERQETGHLIPDDEPRTFDGGSGTYTNAGLARHLGLLYAAGALGTRPLAARLNREGYRTRRGAPFTGNALRHVLESPTYAGFLSWHHRKDRRARGEQLELVAGSWEPLWTPELWEQIQAVRRRHWRGSAGGRMRNVYPLRQLATCDRCDRRLYGEARDNVTYMACVTQRERHACEQRGVRTSVLEDQIGTWLAGLQIPDDWRADAERLQARMARAADEPRPDDRARLTGQIERLQDMYQMGHVEREEYVAKRRALETELTGAPITSIAPVSVLEQAKRLLDDLGRLWGKATATERSEICQTMFASVRVRDQAIVEAYLARPDDYLPLLASSAARAQMSVGLAPPDGSAGTRPTLRIAGLQPLLDALAA
jgi:DNA invertase Pin-like site-specific DNA recombinase